MGRWEPTTGTRFLSLIKSESLRSTECVSHEPSGTPRGRRFPPLPRPAFPAPTPPRSSETPILRSRQNNLLSLPPRIASKEQGKKFVCGGAPTHNTQFNLAKTTWAYHTCTPLLHRAVVVSDQSAQEDFGSPPRGSMYRFVGLELSPETEKRAVLDYRLRDDAKADGKTDKTAQAQRLSCRRGL